MFPCAVTAVAVAAAVVDRKATVAVSCDVVAAAVFVFAVDAKIVTYCMATAEM